MEFELVIVMVLTSLKLSKCGILDKKKQVLIRMKGIVLRSNNIMKINIFYVSFIYV